MGKALTNAKPAIKHMEEIQAALEKAGVKPVPAQLSVGKGHPEAELAELEQLMDFIRDHPRAKEAMWFVTPLIDTIDGGAGPEDFAVGAEAAAIVDGIRIAYVFEDPKEEARAEEAANLSDQRNGEEEEGEDEPSIAALRKKYGDPEEFARKQVDVVLAKVPDAQIEISVSQARGLGPRHEDMQWGPYWSAYNAELLPLLEKRLQERSRAKLDALVMEYRAWAVKSGVKKFTAATVGVFLREKGVVARDAHLREIKTRAEMESRP